MFTDHSRLLSRKMNVRRLLVPVVLLTALTLFGSGLRFKETSANEPGPVVPTTETMSETQTDMETSLDTSLIHGKVIDYESGEPAAGAIVKIFGESADQDQEAITNEKGEFSLQKPGGLHGGLYAVDANHTKMGNSIWVSNKKTQEIPNVTIVLVKAARTITGTVVDTNDRPVEGVLVAGSHQIVRSEIVRTDQEGKFKFLYPEDTQLLRLIAYKRGVGLDICATEEIDPYQRPRGEPGITPPEKISDGPFLLTLAPIEPVQIRVIAEDGQPLAGARVGPWLIQKPPKLPKPEPVMWGSPYAIEREGNNFNTAGFLPFDTVTDENGIATLNSVPNTFLDESTFTAYGPPDGVEGSDGTKRYYGSARNQWEKMDIRDGLPTLTLPRQGSVRGTVKLEDGTPVPNVRICIRWHNGSGGGSQTDENGEFLLSDNVNVIYNLNFDSDKGATPAVFNFSVGDGSEEKKLDIVLTPGIRLHGKVFMPDGSPAEDFSVTVNEMDPNPPASFDRYSIDWETRREGTTYTTNQADRWISKKQNGEPGEYETLLPAVPREYSFRATRYAGKDNPVEISANVSDVRLLGTEKEIKLDFYLSESGDMTCTPLADIPATPTDEQAKPVPAGKQQPWVSTADDPKSGNPMIPIDPVVKVFDKDGKPMKDIEIDVQYNGDDRGGFQVKTDENGVASVKELETKTNTGYVSYRIRQSGYVFQLAEWQRGYGRWNDLPREHAFTLEKAIEVGGIVVDENNNPIQGAAVNCSYNAPDRQNHLYPAGDAKTDTDGKWSVNMAPASIRRFRLDVTHPDYMQSELTGTYPPYSQMLDRTAVVMLRKGTSLTGRVLDPDGQPVKGAKIVVTEKGQEFSAQQPQQTSEDGTFRFDNWKPGPTTVYAAAVGFAPQTKEWTDFSSPVEFQLAPGKTVRFKVLDMDGKPIPQARVCPFRWRGTFLLLGDRDLIPQHADGEGNWSWTWAPDDEVDYSIIREGYQSIRDLNLAARDEPYVYRMRLPLEIRGQVTDAGTGETIRNITLISGGNFDGRNPKVASYWNEDRPSQFTDGNYRAFFDEPRNGGGHHFKITAEGYEMFVSEMFTDDQGSLQFDVKLKRIPDNR